MRRGQGTAPSGPNVEVEEFRMAKTLCGSVAAAFLLALALSGGAGAAPPDLGPNVIVFDPSMPTSQIQATVDTIASKQVSNQFGTERYALLFEPGTYGSATDPLNFQVGYYTSIAGLGRSPGDRGVVTDLEVERIGLRPQPVRRQLLHGA